ncbi:acylphosphatase [Aliiroseovarius sp. PTFE2010]|uniref:acylphosphatase n=1 Tax=Aliiroseovarius sp. PTFE2010 TaxID=3417190 RepID=UPI003CF10E10
MAQVARHLRITGRVQGVAYRAWTHGMATQLGLSGWVQNQHDGSVMALVAGGDAAVDKMISACWGGPGAAQVSDVQVTPADPPDTPGFTILR